MLEQQRQMHKEKRAFVDHQRRLHEQFIREHKDFLGFVNKVKTNQGARPMEEILRECHQVLSGSHNTHDGGSFKHPVFIELDKVTKGTEEDKQRPWSEQNRDRLKVLQM